MLVAYCLLSNIYMYISQGRRLSRFFQLLLEDNVVISPAKPFRGSFRRASLDTFKSWMKNHLFLHNRDAALPEGNIHNAQEYVPSWESALVFLIRGGSLSLVYLGEAHLHAHYERSTAAFIAIYSLTKTLFTGRLDTSTRSSWSTCRFSREGGEGTILFNNETRSAR